MSTSQPKSDFLFLFRNTNWGEDHSPEELQKIIGSFMTWVDDQVKVGTIKIGQPLEMEGKIVSGRNGRTVADGPFAESKEAIGGYFLVSVDSYEDAIELAQQHPLLEYGLTVEVRPIAGMCPAMKTVSEFESLASV